MSASGISGFSSQGQIDSSQREQMKQTREAAMSAAAQALGESEDDLKKDLASGKSLSDLASAKGVSTDDLQKAIGDAVKQANPNATDDQVSQITQRMIAGHHGGHHHHQAQPANADPSSSLPPDATISIKA